MLPLEWKERLNECVSRRLWGWVVLYFMLYSLLYSMLYSILYSILDASALLLRSRS